MKIGFTGRQRGMTAEQLATVREALAAFATVEAVHHGDCTGADAEFHAACLAARISVHIHPPLDDSRRAFSAGAEQTYAAQQYLQRNHAIMDACDLLLAAPSGEREKRRSGTWATVRDARRRGRRIRLVLPGGEIAVEQPAEDGSK